MLKDISRLVSRIRHTKFGFVRSENVEQAGDYWTTRARRYGTRAVVDLRVSDIDAETARQWREVESFLPRPDTTIQRVLDFGCGAGRMTVHLAQYYAEASIVGLDTTKQLLRLAPILARVTYSWHSPGKIELASDSIDFVFVHLVLDAVHDYGVTEYARAIRRVLHNTGEVMIVENVSRKPNQLHWRYRSCEEYRQLMSELNLNVVGKYVHHDEQFAILRGGRRP